MGCRSELGSRQPRIVQNSTRDELSSYRAWVAGDFEEIDRISAIHTQNKFAPIKHAVVTARNCLWLPTVRELVQSANEPTLVLVGVAHLGGSDGLLSQLAAGGLGLTPLELLGG